MFFSREWSIGKVVDYTAQKYKLRNENNQLHSMVSDHLEIPCIF
jgi:hypothetical protein